MCLNNLEIFWVPWGGPGYPGVRPGNPQVTLGYPRGNGWVKLRNARSKIFGGQFKNSVASLGGWEIAPGTSGIDSKSKLKFSKFSKIMILGEVSFLLINVSWRL